MMPPYRYLGWNLTSKWEWDPIEGEYHYVIQCKKGNVTLDIKGSCQDPDGAVIIDQVIAEIDKFEEGRRKQDGHE